MKRKKFAPLEAVPDPKSLIQPKTIRSDFVRLQSFLIRPSPNSLQEVPEPESSEYVNVLKNHRCANFDQSCGICLELSRPDFDGKVKYLSETQIRRAASAQRSELLRIREAGEKNERYEPDQKKGLVESRKEVSSSRDPKKSSLTRKRALRIIKREFAIQPNTIKELLLQKAGSRNPTRDLLDPRHEFDHQRHAPVLDFFMQNLEDPTLRPTDSFSSLRRQEVEQVLNDLRRRYWIPIRSGAVEPVCVLEMMVFEQHKHEQYLLG